MPPADIVIGKGQFRQKGPEHIRIIPLNIQEWRFDMVAKK
jgi:hypothetical protein